MWKNHFKVLNPLRILFIFGLLWDGLHNVPDMLFLAPWMVAERRLVKVALVVIINGY